MHETSQDKSNGNILQNENSLMKEKDQTSFMKEAKNLQVKLAVIYDGQKLIPYFLGGNQGYYSDLAPVPNYDIIEIIFELLSIGVLVVTWIFFQMEFDEFDDEIPIVFNSVGEVVRKGTKLILYILPTLDTFIFVILTLIQFITNRFRYSISVTPENSRQVFQTTRKLILFIKFFTTLVFIFLTFGSISIIKNDLDGYKMAYGVFFLMAYGCFYYVYMIQLQKAADRSS